MEKTKILFDVKGNEVFLRGYPELDGKKGTAVGDGMVFFFSQEWGNQELYIANTESGKIRRMSTPDGRLLVEEKDIDLAGIEKECKKGADNARRRAIRYAGINRWDGFKNGLCALTWMLYPDGRYFADSDGYGADDNEEEVVCAIINTELEIVEPFRPIKDIKAHLAKIRKEG